MGNKKLMDFKIADNNRLNDLYSLLILEPADGCTLPDMKPGQFVQVRIDNSPATYLRRPISINYVDYERQQLWLLVRKAGEGTAHLINMTAGERVNLLLPLGNDFTFPERRSDKILLIGGGVGVAPMLYLGHKLKLEGYDPEFLLGARSKSDLLELELFEKIGKVHISTDDGSSGEHGVVTQHSVMGNKGYARYYCCGPAPMMKAVARKACENGIICEVSLENMMACGLGACLCCVEKTVKGNRCVCTEGPVFNIEELTW